MRSLQGSVFIQVIFPLLVALIPFQATLPQSPRKNPQLKVSAASSLADALKEISLTYTQQYGSEVILILGASSTIARQIEAGASTDLFISADEAKMNYLNSKGLIRPETKINLLFNKLVIIQAKDSLINISSAQDLIQPSVRKIIIGDPKAVPVGIYARQYLESLELWNSIYPKIVAAENTRAALAAVESGNIEVGIVYQTDAAISKEVKVACVLQPLEKFPIIYPAAILKEASQPILAAQYLAWLHTPQSKAIFEKFGFTVLAKPDASN